MTTPDEVQTRGPFIAEYSGLGNLTFADGHSSENGVFWVGQAHDGSIFICFDQELHALVDSQSTVASFSGQTTLGARLETRGPLHLIQQSISSAIRTLLVASETVVTAPESRPITSVRYGLTNFLFFGTEVRDGMRGLPLTLNYHGRTVVGYISMLPDYSSASSTLCAIGGILPTAEFTIDLGLSETNSEDCQPIADSLCRVLSLARGTQIARLYEAFLDNTGNAVAHVHSNRVARNYDGFQLLTHNPEDAERTQTFTETTFPTYVARSSQYLFDRGSLDTYLEGKSGGQYLESRALKLAVTMEMLVARHFSGSVALSSDEVVDPTAFDCMLGSLRENIYVVVLRTTNDSRKARRISERGRVRGLNQRSFAELIRQMWIDIGLHASSASAELFSGSRNRLVHTGNFACSPENRAAWHGPSIPWSEPIEEYGFLMSVLDRTILRILDYDGPYIDWHRLDHPERRMHVNG